MYETRQDLDLFLAGLGLISSHFWIGSGAVYLGVLWLTAEPIWSEWMVRQAYQLQIVFVGVVWIGAGIFTCSFVTRSLPLDLVAFAYPGNYPDGVNVDGIVWKPGMSELRILITNPSNEEYENIDIHVYRTSGRVKSCRSGPGRWLLSSPAIRRLRYRICRTRTAAM